MMCLMNDCVNWKGRKGKVFDCKAMCMEGFVCRNYHHAKGPKEAGDKREKKL